MGCTYVSVYVHTYTDQEASQQYSLATLVSMTENTNNYTGIGAFHICQLIQNILYYSSCTVTVNYE